MKAVAIPPPNAARMTIVTVVSRQFRYTSTHIAMTAVTIDPVSWTRPVPTRFRIPSASDMMREIRMPVFVESK